MKHFKPGMQSSSESQSPSQRLQRNVGVQLRILVLRGMRLSADIGGET